jgi:hypothetical protein
LKRLQVAVIVLSATVFAPPAAAEHDLDVPGFCLGLVLMPYKPTVTVPPGHDSGYVNDQQADDWGWFQYMGPHNGAYLYDMVGSTVNGICLGRGVPPKQS